MGLNEFICSLTVILNDRTVAQWRPSVRKTHEPLSALPTIHNVLFFFRAQGRSVVSQKVKESLVLTVI